MGILIGLIFVILGIGAIFGVNVWKYFSPLLLILFVLCTMTLEISAVFGGVKVIVPNSWKVEEDMSGVFAEFTHTAVASDESQGTLVMRGSAVFGGGEVKN